MRSWALSLTFSGFYQLYFTSHDIVFMVQTKVFGQPPFRIFFINFAWFSLSWLDFILPYLNSATKLGLWLGTRWCSRCGWGTAMSVPLKRCCIRWFIYICLFVFCLIVSFVACLIWVRDGQWPCLFRLRGCFPVCLSVFSFKTLLSSFCSMLCKWFFRLVDFFLFNSLVRGGVKSEVSFGDFFYHWCLFACSLQNQ